MAWPEGREEVATAYGAQHSSFSFTCAFSAANPQSKAHAQAQTQTQTQV